MPEATRELWRAADELLCHRLPSGHLRARLVGVGVSGLDDTGQVQGMLFDQEDRQKQARLDTAVDELNERFGAGAIRRGSGLDRDEKARPD